jgi:hypothetical protein
MRHLIADFDAGPKSAWRKRDAVDRVRCSDLRETRFWIASGLPTIHQELFSRMWFCKTSQTLVSRRLLNC